MRSWGSGYYGVGALDALAREVARAPLPDLDWDRVERGLFARIGHPEPQKVASVARRVAPGRTGSVWSIALAAAAAVAVTRLVPHDDGRASRVSPVTTSSDETPLPAMLAGSLKRGDVAEAGLEPLRYESRGNVTFTLAPASRVRVLSDGSSLEVSPRSPVRSAPAGAPSGAMTVALLDGSIHAEVVPHSQGEVFAVEVGQTRIAAHGTSFTVSRHEDRVLVEVVHGSVAVGPAGHPGATHGWLLVGPDKASFSLDGGQEATWMNEPSVIVGDDPGKSPTGDGAFDVAAPESSSVASAGEPTDRLEAFAPSPHRPRAAASGRRARDTMRTAGEGTNTVEGADRQKPAIAGIVNRVTACYERQVASFGVRFSIKSSLTLTVAPNGTVREGVFDPPLSPTLMACARDAIAAARFPQDNATVVVRLPLVLSPGP
jgi:ferric-dicitrate binding protein FerR (iron transport regulator)